MNVYKCLTQDFGILQKKINRVTKKLDKYGKEWKFEILGVSAEKVAVYDYSGSEHIPSWQFQPKRSFTVLEVTSYTFEIESLKIGNYKVIAVLEHMSDTDMNIVHVVDEDENKEELTAKYVHTASKCFHCNHNRYRSKTVILQDASGERLQVGTTCLHEYTGIDCLDIIKNYMEIEALLINTVSIDHEHREKYGAGNYEKTIDYLASCLRFIDEKGYIKEETKHNAWADMHKGSLERWFETAIQIVEYFKANQFTDNFMSNIKAALLEVYTKKSGFIAYAPIAWQKALEYDVVKAEKEEKAKASRYVGEVGDKLTLDLTIENTFSFESYYGYQNVYIFKDGEGNVYKWVTGNRLWKDENSYMPYTIGDCIKLKGTVKEHDEYEGTKQTVLTRCKLQ